MMPSEWHIGNVSNLEVIELCTMNPTPERCQAVDGFPD